MGLGKTLSMLTAIVMSLDESRAFMYSQHRVDIDNAVSYLRRASSTLIIAPSAGESLAPELHQQRSLLIVEVLLDGWQDEIQRSVRYTTFLSPYLTELEDT